MGRTALLLLLLLLAPGVSRAALVGNIFSGPTTGDGASIYHNPGAMTLLSGTHAMAFGAVSAIRLHYQRDTVSAYDDLPYPQANVFIAKPNVVLGVVTDATLDRLRFGLGVTLPIIDGATWSEDYEGRPASTRYFAINARQLTFMISPAVAYRAARFISVGFGMDIIGVMLHHDVMTDFGAKVNQMACAVNPGATCLMDTPLTREDPTYDARTVIDGMGWGVGFFGGVLITPTPWLRIGGSFHTGGVKTISAPVELSVDLPPAVTDFVARSLPSVTLPPLSASADVDTVAPMIATFGVAAQVTSKLELAADLQWFDYSSTSLLVGTVREGDALDLIHDQVLIKARTDSYLVGLRGAYQLWPTLRAALRLEYENNTRPEEFTTPVSIDFHKISFHLGVAWRVSRVVTLTAEYGHYFMPGRTVSHSRFAPNARPTTPEEEGFDKNSPTGHYFVEADRLGVGLVLGF